MRETRMDEHEVRDESAHKDFTIIPNTVILWPGMTHSALRLYLWYKMVCGEKPGGRCWTSLNTVADGCAMSRHTVIAARKKLTELGLVDVSRSKTSAGNSKITVTIKNVWGKEVSWRQVNGSAKQALAVQGSSAKQTLTPVQSAHSASAIRALELDLLNYSKVNKTSPLAGDSEIGFALDGEKKHQPDEADKLAKKLYQGLHRYDLVLRWPNMGAWGTVIRKFLKETTCTVEKFSSVLDWYVEHIRDEFVPQAYSAKSFVEKFEKIVAAKNRSQEDNHEPVEDEYVPPPRATPEETAARRARMEAEDAMFDLPQGAK